MLDRKATSHTKNNDIYTSWVHAHFKMKLITDVWGAVQFFSLSLSLSLFSFFLFIPSTSSLAASSKTLARMSTWEMPPYSLSGRAHGWADGMWMSSTSTPMYLLPCAPMKEKKSNIWTHPFYRSRTGNVSRVCVCVWKDHWVVRFEGRHLAPQATAFITGDTTFLRG